MLRRVVQLGFLLLVLIGVYVLQSHCELWCPMGGVESLYSYIHDGSTPCSIGVSNFFILAGVLAATLLMRRCFCSYACPIGTISEWLHVLACRLKIRTVSIPEQIDRPLRLLKYVVLFVILYFTYKTGELVFRGYDPCYALIGRHGEDITIWAYVICGIIIVVSVARSMPAVTPAEL